MPNHCLNLRLINALRHAHRPLQEDLLSSLYEGPAHLEEDLETLQRHRLVQVTPHGVLWRGT